MPADAVVMDFFAGSGTTGHAVALQNVADGGTRRCISVNSAEPTRPGSNADLAGYATVADITRARLQAVADTLGGGFEAGLAAFAPQPPKRIIMSDVRVALVTGASSGIGEATASLLRSRGFEVYAVARRVDRMAGLAADGVHTFAMDVTDDASMVAGVQRVVDEQGRIDVLVNNAGYGSYGAVEDVPIDEARRQFEVNVFGLARLTQLVLPTCASRAAAGSSTSPRSAGSSTSRWARGTTRRSSPSRASATACAWSSSPFGIDVVIIEPGPIITEWNTISRDSLVETSRGGAYEERAERVGATMARGDSGWAGSSPDVVARKIVKAATTAHPRARYPVGRGAGTIVRARRCCPTRRWTP